MSRALLTLAALAALAVPASAEAAPVAALDRTVVWVSGEYGSEVLMQRSPDGRVARVAGAPAAVSYRSIDLGRNRANRLVLTYLRCGRGMRCVARRDNLRGRRASVRGLEPRGCALTVTPALWRTRTAYGLSCPRGERRSGLYVKTGSRAPRRLALPRDAKRAGATLITRVDLRGTEVAAVAADIYEYAFAQRVDGSRMRSFFAAASEGESSEHVQGLALGSGGALWALVNAEHTGDPHRSILFRLEGSCHQYERLTAPDSGGPDAGFPATGMGVDGRAVFLEVPGAGIIAHDFAPERAC